MRFERLWDSAWWSIVEWWHPASHVCLTKEWTELASVFCISCMLAYLTGSCGPDKWQMACLHQWDLPEQEVLPSLCSSETATAAYTYEVAPEVQAYGIVARVDWFSTNCEFGPHLACHSSKSSLEIHQNVKLFPTRTKNSQHWFFLSFKSIIPGGRGGILMSGRTKSSLTSNFWKTVKM